MLRRGHVYWAQLDRRRPVVMLSVNPRNELAADVVVLECTTRQRGGNWHVALKKGEGGLPAPTDVKCESPRTLPKEDVFAGALGPPLSEQRMREIERALMRALGIAAS